MASGQSHPMTIVIQRVARRFLNANPIQVLGISGFLLGTIAFADFAVSGISLGILYLVPILIASAFLRRWEVVLVALACTFLREFLDSVPFDWGAPARGLRSFTGFAGAGLFVAELTRNRRLLADHVRELEEQIALRKEAQEQLSILINTSPAAILITDVSGTVLMANQSAEELLGFPSGSLVGESIHPYLPAVETVPLGEGARTFRTALECRGQRRNGAVFIAQVWFSTYTTASGPRAAMIVLDASEGLRDREGAGLYSLMRTSRIVMGAVSHSVRNLCAASKVSYTNLARRPELKDSEELKALGTLIRGLESISTADLERSSERHETTVDLHTLLDEMRVVIEPAYEEAGIELTWDIPRILPAIVGEHYGLLHALLNLTQNSERALSSALYKRMNIAVRNHQDRVEIAFTDSAGGVRNPELLFQPFVPGASGSGLGLYVSRAIVRSFDGDLAYEPVAGGSCFRVSLRAAYNRIAHAATSDSD